MADFERACLAFAEGMQGVLEPPGQAGRKAPALPLVNFGPRKPAKRAAPREVDAVRRPLAKP